MTFVELEIENEFFDTVFGETFRKVGYTSAQQITGDEGQGSLVEFALNEPVSPA